MLVKHPSVEMRRLALGTHLEPHHDISWNITIDAPYNLTIIITTLPSAPISSIYHPVQRPDGVIVEHPRYYPATYPISNAMIVFVPQAKVFEYGAKASWDQCGRNGYNGPCRSRKRVEPSVSEGPARVLTAVEA